MSLPRKAPVNPVLFFALQVQAKPLDWGLTRYRTGNVGTYAMTGIPPTETEPERPESVPPLPVGEVQDADWRDWDDSVAFQDSRMPEEDELDFDSSMPSLEDVDPADVEHFDPFGGDAPPKGSKPG